MNWLDDLSARHEAGEDPVGLYAEYQQHIADEQERERLTPVDPETRKLMAAWLAKDRDALDRWTIPEGTHLTPVATRMLLTGWDQKDRQSQ